jgi:hypothetical protein
VHAALFYHLDSSSSLFSGVNGSILKRGKMQMILIGCFRANQEKPYEEL